MEKESLTQYFLYIYTPNYIRNISMQSFTLTELMLRAEEIRKIVANGDMVNVEGKVSNVETKNFRQEISIQCHYCGYVRELRNISPISDMPKISSCVSTRLGGCGEKWTKNDYTTEIVSSSVVHIIKLTQNKYSFILYLNDNKTPPKVSDYIKFPCQPIPVFFKKKSAILKSWKAEIILEDIIQYVD